jgi:hypothetical protein
MSLAINKILVAGANANSEGAYFQAETITVPQNSAYVLAAGAYYVYPTANVVIQVNDNTNGAAFANVYAAKRWWPGHCRRCKRALERVWQRR